jgi:hypothetical protein
MTMTTHRHEITVTSTNAKGEQATEHLELASTYADTPQKAADAAAKLLAGNQNGGMGVFDRVSDKE